MTRSGTGGTLGRPGDDVEFKILGPFEVHDSAGGPLRLPAGRERALLVALLLRRGEVVSVDALVEALWGAEPPATAAKAIQGYVSHLRRALEAGTDAADRVLVTQAPGYVLRVDEGHVDAIRFERLAAEGRRALEDDASAEALSVLDAALSLWRGGALAEFAFDDFAQNDIRRLEELRLETFEDRGDALLRLGRHAGLVSELEAHVAAHPLRGRLRGQLMLALYRSGRQADALQVYRDGRRLLASELGLDPDTELQRLEQAVLAQDPALAAPIVDPRPATAPEPSAERPEPAVAPRRARPQTRAVVLGLAFVAALAAAAVAFVLTRDDTPASVSVVPPAVAVVDPATNRVVASIDVGSKPVAIVGGEGAVWVGDARDGTVTRIDPVTRTVSNTIGIGTPAIDLAAGGGSIWVATGGFGEVVRIDSEVAAVADRIDLGEAGDPIVPAVSSIGFEGGRVWAGAFDGLVRIDPRSGAITARVDLDRTAAQQMATGHGAIWATILSSRAQRVEAASAQVTAEFYAGSFVYPIALGSDAVWVGGAPGQLWKVDPVTAATLLTARVGSFPSGIALGADAVWATLPDDGDLARVDPASGVVLATIHVGGPAEDVAAHGGLIWIAVPKEPTAG